MSETITQADINYLHSYTKLNYPKLLPEDAEDCVQDALLRFYRDKKYDPAKGNLRSFLMLLVKTEVGNYFQRLYADKRDASKTDSLTAPDWEDDGAGYEAPAHQIDVSDVDLRDYEAGLQPDTVTGELETTESTTALEVALQVLTPELQAAVEAALSGDKTWPCKSPRCPAKLELARQELRKLGVELPIPVLMQDKPASYAELREQLQADIDSITTNYFGKAPGVTAQEAVDYNVTRKEQEPELTQWAKQGMKAQASFSRGLWAPPADVASALKRGIQKANNYKRGKAGGRPTKALIANAA